VTSHGARMPSRGQQHSSQTNDPRGTRGRRDAVRFSRAAGRIGLCNPGSRAAVHDIGPGGFDSTEGRSWREFGRLLTSFAGWGMRLVIVPENDLKEETRIEVREPEDKRSP
jgi:hypothetical protein